MTIQELADRFKEISLNHKEVKSWHIGNTWDMAASKSSDVYPAVWMELPVLVTYTLANEKVYTFSLDVLMLPKQDDLYDEVSVISQCEVIADQLMQAFKLYIKNITIGTMEGLSLKNLNADIAAGVRVDIKVNTNRDCNTSEAFRETMIRI